MSVFAAQLGGRAIWLVPLSFVTVMAIGGGLGLTGVKMPLVDIGIGLSVVVLGLAIAFRLSIATVVAMALVAVFAVLSARDRTSVVAPGIKPDWREPAVLAEELETIVKTPGRPPRTAGHIHAH